MYIAFIAHISGFKRFFKNLREIIHKAGLTAKASELLCKKLRFYGND